jgi:uncharacterized protein YycO
MMQNRLWACLLLAYTLGACQPPNSPTEQNKANKTKSSSARLQNGDIIFQVSLSGQGKAIKLATHSDYTHCGIVFEQNKQFFVAEAIQPVTITPLQTWIARGDKGHFVVKRLKNAETVLTSQALQKMWQVGKQYVGKPYDIHFGWSDQSIYCSELVWKVYKAGTGIEVGKLQRIKDFDLTSTEVKQKMRERYGNAIPYQEMAISPAQIFNSPLLETIANPIY